MSAGGPSYYDADRQFQRIAWSCVLFYALVAGVMNVIKIEKPPQQDFTQLSPRIAQLIVEAAKPLPPPPVVEVPKVKEEPAPEAPKEEPKKVEEKTAEKVAPSAGEPAAEPAPGPTEVAKQEGPTPDQIRAEQEQQRRKNVEVAMNSGLLRVLKQSPTTRTESKRAQRVFSQVSGLTNDAPKQAAGISPVAVDAPVATKGIDDIVAKLQKDLVDSRPMIPDKPITGSGGVGSVVTDARAGAGSPMGGGAGGGGSALKEHKTAAVDSPFQVKGYEDGNLPRTLEEIADVVDSYKGGTAFLYNKYLRENPTLRGTLTLEFTILANGEVIDIRIVSSTMKYLPFEEALIKRMLQWRFPAIAAGNMTIVYPMIFSVTG